MSTQRLLIIEDDADQRELIRETLEDYFGRGTCHGVGSLQAALAMDLGSCREVIKDGQTGFLVNNVDAAVRAVKRAGDIDRNACRQRVQECFCIETMVEAYERVYQTIFEQEAKRWSDDTPTTRSSPKPISRTR